MELLVCVCVSVILSANTDKLFAAIHCSDVHCLARSVMKLIGTQRCKCRC